MTCERISLSNDLECQCNPKESAMNGVRKFLELLLGRLYLAVLGVRRYLLVCIRLKEQLWLPALCAVRRTLRSASRVLEGEIRPGRVRLSGRFQGKSVRFRS